MPATAAAISTDQADRLFWLGRYVERVYSTLRVFNRAIDRMLDHDESSYIEFCRRLSIYHLSERGGVVEIEFSKLSALNPDRVINLLRLSDGKVQMDSRHMDKMRMQTSAVSLKDKALFILEQLRRLL